MLRSSRSHFRVTVSVTTIFRLRLVWQGDCTSRPGDCTSNDRGAGKMFKITTCKDSGTIRLVVEGKLARLCVGELDHCWQAARLGKPSVSILMDLTGVTYIDESGKLLLARMHKEGTVFLCSGLLTKFLIDEIKSGDKISLCKN